MEMEHFLAHLKKTNQLEKINHINADGTPSMKHKYIRDLYHEYLYQQTPNFECSICMENINDNMCKLKCGHTFCVECFSNLARTSNKCALCRDKLSEKKVKKEINQNILIDVVNYELDTPYAERDDLNLCDYIQETIKKFVEGGNHSERILARTADAIAMEVFDSLHSVAFITMEAINRQDNDS